MQYIGKNFLQLLFKIRGTKGKIMNIIQITFIRDEQHIYNSYILETSKIKAVKKLCRAIKKEGNYASIVIQNVVDLGKGNQEDINELIF